MQLFRSRGTLLVEDVRQKRYADHKVVTVHLNKVVTSDGCGVNVVFSEWTNEAPSEPGIDAAESVCSPMNESRSEVGRQDAKKSVEDYTAPDRVVPCAEQIEKDQDEETYRHCDRDLFLESLLS